MQQLLGPLGYTDPSNTPAPIPMLVPATYKIGIGETSAEAWCTNCSSQGVHLLGQQLPPSHPRILSGGKQGINLTSQRAKVTAAWLVITLAPRPPILYNDSWAVLKGLTLWLRQRKKEGWMMMNKALWGKRCGRIFGLAYKSLRQISLSSRSLPIGYPHPEVIRKQMPWQKYMF